MRNKRLKQIDQKLDFLIAKVDVLTEILVSKFDIDIEHELAKDNEEVRGKGPIEPEIEAEAEITKMKTNREQAEDDHYFDPTKYPEVGVSESDEHFNN